MLIQEHVALGEITLELLRLGLLVHKHKMNEYKNLTNSLNGTVGFILFC